MESEPEVFVTKIVSPSTARNFFLSTTFFQNGCFIVITEGQPRIGAVSIVISTVAEKVSSMINGISLVSLHSKSQLQLDDMKAIMEEVMNTVSSKSYEKQ